MNTIEYNGLSPLSSEYSQYRIINDTIYMLPGGYNGLFRASISDGQVESLKKFIQRSNYGVSPFYLCQNGNQLFFLPASANGIAIYDFEEDDLCEILLEQSMGGTREYAFVNGCLWLFPLRGDKIIEFDYEEKRIVSSIDLKSVYVKETGKTYKFFPAYGCYCYGELIFLACYESPYLVVFNMKTGEITFNFIQETQTGFTALIGRDKWIYAIGVDGRLMIWDIDERRPETFINITENVPDFDARYYVCINIVGTTLFICDGRDITQVIKISLSNDSVFTQWSGDLLDELKGNNMSQALRFSYYDGDLLYGCDNSEHYFCIDLSMEKLEWVREITYDPNLLKRFIKDDSMLLNRGQKVIPEDAITLEDFIGENMQNTILESTVASVGNCIYQNVMRDL